MSSGPRDLVGTLISALLGVVALISCGLVVVLTDDDLGGTDPAAFGAGSSSGGVPALPGESSAGGAGDTTSGGSAGGSLTTPAPTSCTKTVCPALGPPTRPPGPFPFPPGARPVLYAEDFCQDQERPGSTVREVRGSLDEVRDYYLANLLDAGYGWGLGTLSANPFATTASGREVPLGWEGALTTLDNGSGGSLALEAKVGPRTVCGPGAGVVYITMDAA